MPTNYRIFRGFLYALLFLSFLSLSAWQPAAHWLRDNYGLGAMFGGMAIFIGFICGVVWMINHINRKWQVVDPNELRKPFSMPYWVTEDTMNISRTVAGYSEKVPPGDTPVEFDDPSKKKT